MRTIYGILFSILILFSACNFSWKPLGDDKEHGVKVMRYDRLECRYLSTGDFSALQEMETEYPIETRTLIENVLGLGHMNEQNIGRRFLMFFQDSTLQNVITDSQAQFANMDDINESFDKAFTALKKELPEVEIPRIYSQISALSQSVVIGNHVIGISLDKYLGENYPIYRKYYNEQQRKAMTRANIVPDCVSFYLLSLYPIKGFERRSQRERDLHVGKIMWICNQAMESRFFNTQYTAAVEKYMDANKKVSYKALLEIDDFSVFDNYL